MVKNKFKIITYLLVLFFLFLNNGCNVDLSGLFVSNDLDERLKERDNLKLLDKEGWSSLSLKSEFSFLVLTDLHIEDANARGFEKIKNVITDETAFIVVLGDITQNGAAKDIDKFIEIAKTFGIPCYPVIGNHDIYFGGWSVWKEKIGSTSYMIDGGNAALFILDTANSIIGKDQIDWLERNIRTAKKRVFVFTHSPLFVTGPADLQQITDTKERARIVSILSNRCDYMFMGHLHKRIVHEAGNVKYINIDDFKKTKTYCVVTVTETSVSYNFMKL